MVPVFTLQKIFLYYASAINSRNFRMGNRGLYHFTFLPCFFQAAVKMKMGFCNCAEIAQFAYNQKPDGGHTIKHHTLKNHLPQGPRRVVFAKYYKVITEMVTVGIGLRRGFVKH